jgi:GDPmannose 4,6-dehydratase
MSPRKKRALVTGITGQDGSYLAELLLRENYEVHGLIHSGPQDNIAAIANLLELHSGSLDNHQGLREIVQAVRPDECYHFAGSSFYQYAPSEEQTVINNNFASTETLLSSIRSHAPDCRFFFAGSSEMFGDAKESPQSESTAFFPETVYAKAKLKSFQLIRELREKQGLFACTGILFNHESPRRGLQFVTRKITSTVARIKTGHEKNLVLGNLETIRDWGYAPDYVQAAWKMLQAEQPDDFVIATGTSHTVRDFVQKAFEFASLDYLDYVVCDPKFYREKEKVARLGDSSKLRDTLQWAPSRSFESMIEEMVASDLKQLQFVAKSR